MTTIQKQLFAMQDKEYRDFHSRLMPGIDKKTIIGVRTPQLRKYAAMLSKDMPWEFLSGLPHKYYEENNLHGFLIEKIKDYDLCISQLDSFLPYVDNWATCDMTNPKALKKNLPALEKKITQWLGSGETYIVRFGMKCLMDYFLTEEFDPEYFNWVRDAGTEDYYVKMMAAWYYATALAIRYEETLDFLKGNTLDAWTHNKAIQKAVESRRITREQKDELRQLKRKGADIA